MRGRAAYDKVVYAASLVLLLSPLLAYASGQWVNYWKLITSLGDEQAYVALATVVFVAFSPDLGFTMLLALLSSAWLNVLLKNAFALPRPPPEQWKVPVEGYGFPSGHAQTSSAFWSSAYLYTRRLPLAALGAVVVALVSASRLALGVHYPRDVVGGAAIGLAVSAAAVYLGSKLLCTRAARSSLALLAYSALVALLYLFQSDLTILRAAGVLAGASLYPLLRDKIALPRSVRARLVVTVAVLAFAFLATQLSKLLAAQLQLAVYAVVAAVIVASPLAYRKLV